MNLDLTGKVALITGGGSGIGAACAHQLAQLGAHVVVADIRQPDPVTLGVADALSLGVDVTDPEQVDSMVTRVLDRHGALDVAINCAGVGMPVKAPVAETEYTEWRRLLSVNLDGTFLCMRSELGVMKSGASIVNVASVTGLVSVQGASPYASSKHGLIGLTKTAALDYAAAGIRVNAVAPGFIDTPLLRGPDAETRSRLSAAHPLGRLGTAEEVASAICFLAAPAASFITGSVLVVDGGYLAR
ncbi:SDR family NAD(P)-dependent oxidoreductase [Gordonia westfalica]|uniref:NAD(P)-dependent dehydrogenase, short-chain alcohol dehydrogenase family n=1 Tax=Gordonia westfalica TaxID=158898 RepID=A0A1H2LF43_9ACTN|nr:SDR family oxidoreductase [Gordonia westfalica]SDU79345.1 NAD(P)-dependent dehydrogenase, short-chain alcohol dehydrogenase family [Gordonia westfalica]